MKSEILKKLENNEGIDKNIITKSISTIRLSYAFRDSNLFFV